LGEVGGRAERGGGAAERGGRVAQGGGARLELAAGVGLEEVGVGERRQVLAHVGDRAGQDEVLHLGLGAQKHVRAREAVLEESGLQVVEEELVVQRLVVAVGVGLLLLLLRFAVVEGFLWVSCCHRCIRAISDS